MIVRPVPDGLLCIRQPDHAALAGTLAHAWGGAFPRLRPREPVELAVRTHDDGWADLDEAPVRDPETGAPFTYRTIPTADAIGVADRSVARASEADPYAGWLVSRHFASFHERSADPDARRWVVAQVGQRSELLSRAWPLVGREALHPHVLEGNLDVLQLLDALSLALCEAWPEWESRGISAAYGEETTVFRFRRLARDSHGTVDPWPFDVPEILATIPARTLPGSVGEDPSELVAAWNAATPVSLEVALTRR